MSDIDSVMEDLEMIAAKLDGLAQVDMSWELRDWVLDAKWVVEDAICKAREMQSAARQKGAE